MLPAQKEFHNDSAFKILGFLGGLGSGKSFALMMKLLKLSWQNKNFSGGLLSPSVEDFKRDMLPMFEECFASHGLQNLAYYHKQDKCFYFPWTSGKLYVFSGEKAIAGPNLAYCGINEPSLIKYERINEMMRRVRVKNAPVKQRCMAGTPEDIHGWLQDFIEEQTNLGNLRLIQAKTGENKFLDPEYVQHLKDTLDPAQFRLFAEGELIRIGSNLFYYSWTKENETDIELDPDMPLLINVDFNVGRMTATVAQKYMDGHKKIIVFCDELVLTDYNSDTYALVNAIKQKYDYLWKNRYLITCDFAGKARKTTGPSDVEVLKKAFGDDSVRYNITGNIRLRQRQILMNGLLHHHQILVNPKKCPTLRKDFLRVQQELDYTKKKVNEQLTHASDTADYLCDFEFDFNDRKRFNNYKAM